MIRILTALALTALSFAPASAWDCDDRLQRPIVTITPNGDRLYDNVNTAVGFCTSALDAVFTQESNSATDNTSSTEPSDTDTGSNGGSSNNGL